MNYTYKGINFKKISEELEGLSSHSSIEIPNNCNFAKELGKFKIENEESYFYIRDGKLLKSFKSKEKNDIFNLLHQEYYNSIEKEENNLATKSTGEGTIYNWNDLTFRKVGKHYKGGGCFQHFDIDKNDPHYDFFYQLDGLYRIFETNEIFYISCNSIEIREGKKCKLFDLIKEKCKKRNTSEEEGPYGGAFASENDFWNWKKR